MISFIGDSPMLLFTHQLDATQYQDLEQLTEHCLQHDQGLPMLYRDLLLRKRSTESLLLYYEKNQLIGFLSAFFFYEDACELTLLVTPAYRRQGIATHLLQQIMPLLRTKCITTLIFSMPLSYGEHWLPSYGFTYMQSDYHMQRDSLEPQFISPIKLGVQKAVLLDLDTLCHIDKLCFPAYELPMQERFTHLLRDPNYLILLAFFNNEAIGKAHINWQENQTLLSDIAILPRYQRQGFGHELLGHCINHILSAGKINISLDVEENNQKALNLYLDMGFKTVHSHDYWSIRRKKLEEYFNSEEFLF